jgi:hypothetical protein
MTIRKGDKLIACNYSSTAANIDLSNLSDTGKQLFDSKANVNLDNLSKEALEVLKGLSSNGLEIGDIGIAPLGIDETQNKRRYLNGQLIMQDQFVSFTKKVKKAIELNPSLACTEEEWQATVTMSTFGQCGKFVIDDTKGTIRLPKITGFIQGLTDLTSLAELVVAGVPSVSHTHTRGTMDITGSFYSGPNSEANYGGCVYGVSNNGCFTYSAKSMGSTFGYSFTNKTTNVNGDKVTFTASRSWTGATSTNSAVSSVYGKSNTVQPESVRYPYFIQVANGVGESVDVTREIELNNPFSLFDVKWSPSKLNNISWLISEGQANSYLVYTTAYEELLRAYNAGTDETETVAGISITFRRDTETERKITIDKGAYDSILNATGTAWYFVLDITEQVFYLPQTDGFFQFGGAGDFVEAGLPNITGSFTIQNIGVSNPTGVFTASNNYGGNGTVGDLPDVISFKASNSNPIYGNSTTVQPNAVKGHLYFYVGETVQNANIVNLGRIEETMITDIVRIEETIASNVEQLETAIDTKVDKSSIRYDSSTATLYIGV